MKRTIIVALCLLVSACRSKTADGEAKRSDPVSAPTTPTNGSSGSAESSCSGPIGQPCVDYARALLFGDDGVRADPKRSRELAQKACEAGVGSGCTLVGLAYSSALGDAREASKWLARGCDAGDAAGCGAAAYQYLHGGLPGEAQGVEIAPSRGVGFAKRACELHDQRGCSLLARAYANGTGVAQDLEQARVLSTQACAADDAAGCSIAAQLAQHDGNADDANRLLRRSCQLGNQAACNR